MKFGNLTIKNGASLAPMAGLTDATLRTMAANYGATYIISEMVSAKALSFGDKKSAALCKHTAVEGVPYGIQLFGSEPAIMAQAAAFVMKYKPDFIDINMGCPAPKITNNGCGSALMKNPPLCGELVKAVVEAVDIPVTIKIRKGFDDSSLTALEVAKRAEAAGAAAVTLHARTREQMYRPPVDYTSIAALKQAVSIPVIGNGDITTVEEALSVVEQTGCDQVMVGRGALGRPWFFSQLAAAFNGQPIPAEPTLKEKMCIMQKHVYDMCNDKGEAQAMRECRTQVAWYMHGLQGAARLRGLTSSLTYYTDIEELAQLVLKLNS